MRKLIILMTISLVFSACSSSIQEPVEEIHEEPVQEALEEIITWPFTEALTGIGTDVETKKAIAVMIGNTVEARPASGLSQADIVYEIMVEYQVTRLMAIFSSQFPEKVGPIRSVRMPFVQKIEELKLGVAHYGGASVGQGDALGYLDRVKPPIRYDGVGGMNTTFFSRDSARKAPHNAYIDLSQAVTRAPDMTLDVLRYQDTQRTDGSSGTKLRLRYSRGFEPSYVYQEEQGKYQRFFNNEEQIDLNNNAPILVTNIILQYVQHRTAEAVGYVLVDFVGTGKAQYLIQGRLYEGTWERSGVSARTIYKDASGQEMKFQPGNTWIQVVLSSTNVEFE